MKNKEPELPFAEQCFIEKWNEWLAYRSEKRLPKYKPIGLKKTLARLKNESGGNVVEAIDMLEYSMEQNWQGIFKRNNNGKAHQRTLPDGTIKSTRGERTIKAYKEWGLSSGSEG